MDEGHKRSALGLFGGGLDSLLAFRRMADAGFRVAGVHFRTGFVRSAHEACALRAAGEGRLEVVDVRQPYLEEVVAEPRHGYGSGMNPCRDCRTFMLREAARMAAERGIDLLFTGDVVGQRAHDQSHATLRAAERDAGVAGRVMRPLSAAHLPAGETAPPLPGDDRLHGRSRRGQLALAARLGIEAYPTPSGRCCRLADPAFARRLRDYLAHTPVERRRADDLGLLARGRHFRLAWDLKVVLGRDETESRWLAARVARRGSCRPANGPGPFGLIEGRPEGELLGEVAAIVARYTQSGGEEVAVAVVQDGDERVVTAPPAADDRLAEWRV